MDSSYSRLSKTLPAHFNKTKNQNNKVLLRQTVQLLRYRILLFLGCRDRNRIDSSCLCTNRENLRIWGGVVIMEEITFLFYEISRFQYIFYWKLICHLHYRNVPYRIRVRLSRKRNEDEDSPNKLYTLVTYVPVTTFKGKVPCHLSSSMPCFSEEVAKWDRSSCNAKFQWRCPTAGLN